MKFLLVDAAESLVSRVDFSGRVGGGIQKRTSQPYSRGGGGGEGIRKECRIIYLFKPANARMNDEIVRRIKRGEKEHTFFIFLRIHTISFIPSTRARA